jgi:fosfomycin resistance protein FosX
MPIQGISHITFIVRNLERMAIFLCERLGAVEVYDSNDRNFSLSREKFFVLGGVWLAAMQGESPTERSYRHLAFKVEEDELPGFQAKQQAPGADVMPPR